MAAHDIGAIGYWAQRPLLDLALRHRWLVLVLAISSLSSTIPARRAAIEELLFRETTTLGVRRQEWDRTVLERETATVETAYGPIRVKIGRRGSTVYNAWPEFDDCARAASNNDVAVKQVLAEALAAYLSTATRGGAA